MTLVDSDVMVDLLRRYPPAVAWLNSLGEEEICLPGFVWMELVQGCRSKDERQAMESRLGSFSRLWPSAQACEDAAQVFARRHISHGLGILDALIGQMAVDVGLPLCTFNQKHYAAIAGIRTVQPYKRDASR